MSEALPRVTPLTRKEAETCEYIGPQGVYWSKGPAILFSETVDDSPKPIARIPLSLSKRLLAATRAGRRLGRQTFYNLLPLPDGSLFFTYGSEIGFIHDGVVTMISGRSRNFRILRNGIATMPDGSIVFGEYRSNPERSTVSLYRWNPGETAVHQLYEFRPGEVRHVHSVSWDPFENKAVVATGDADNECRLIAFDVDFSSPAIIGQGSEEWRTISPRFSPDAIYFGTDAEFQQNYIYRYDRGSKVLRPLAGVNGPVFYSAPLGSGWVFCTTAELCPSQTSPDANIYYLDGESDSVYTVASFPKDGWSKKYFQFGVLNLPILGGPTERIPVSGTALTGLDGRFVLLES